MTKATFTIAKAESLASLTGREREVLEEYYINGKTIDEIGRQFQVTRERIQQIRKKALRKLKAAGQN